jgi:hypothetical protein
MKTGIIKVQFLEKKHAQEKMPIRQGIESQNMFYTYDKATSNLLTKGGPVVAPPPLPVAGRSAITRMMKIILMWCEVDKSL